MNQALTAQGKSRLAAPAASASSAADPGQAPTQASNQSATPSAVTAQATTGLSDPAGMAQLLAQSPHPATAEAGRTAGKARAGDQTKSAAADEHTKSAEAGATATSGPDGQIPTAVTIPAATVSPLPSVQLPTNLQAGDGISSAQTGAATRSSNEIAAAGGLAGAVGRSIEAAEPGEDGASTTADAAGPRLAALTQASPPALALPEQASSTTAAAVPLGALTQSAGSAATPTSGGPAASASHATSSSPASQVATAITEPVQVIVAAPSTPGAPQTMTIHLKPVELGRVEVRIERSAEGPTKVELAVERPDTLMMLVRDQSHLHQALDQAGVPQDGRTVQFSLSPDPAPAQKSGSGLLGDSGGSGAGAGGNGGQRSGYPGGNGRGGQDQGAAPTTSYFAWTRSGIDITA